MRVAGRFHLTYCSSIHPGETWQAVSDALRMALPRIRTLLNFHEPLAVGLRLSAEAAASLEAPDALAEFRTFLADGNYYVPTINGFPYGAFHGQRVKERAYLPDWRDSARVEYTNRLARLLAELLDDRRDIEGSVSTVPGAFGRDSLSEVDAVSIASNLLRHAGHLVSLRRKGGAAVTLALEPEPACFIETIDDAVAFFTTYLFAPRVIAGISRELHVPMTVDDVRRHVGVCLDACHMAVEFEEAATAVHKLQRAGVRVCKVQVSSALQLDNLDAVALNAALAPFAEDTYLHQVVERTAAGFRRYADLPEALVALARDSPSVEREWRVHFHVPIFLATMNAFGTTQSYLIAMLDLLKREPICPYLEIETYSWGVLPEQYRAVDVCTAIGRELVWARAQLDR